MKTKVIEIVSGFTHDVQVNTALSLKPFLKYIDEQVTKTSDNIKAGFFKYIAERIHRLPDLDKPIDLEEIDKYIEPFEYIYLTLLPPAIDETKIFWALAVPLSPVMFYGTNAFYDFILNDAGAVRGIIKQQDNHEEKEQQRLSLIYSFALRYLYNYQLPINNEIIQIVPEEKTELKKAFKIQFDTRYLELKYNGEKLPDIPLNDLHIPNNTFDKEALNKLQEILPLKDLYIEGFSIVNFTDITASQAIENIKNIIVNLQPQQMVYDEVIESLKNLIGVPGVYMRIVPMLKVNDKLVVNSFENLNFKIKEVCSKYNIGEQFYMHEMEEFSKNPRLLLKKDMDKYADKKNNIYQMFYKMGIMSMAVVPIIYQKKLVGIIEMFSKTKNAINETTITALEPAIPLLEQLLQTNIDDFEIMLDDIIKDKFTSLQSSVEWKFNEAAWHYLENKRNNKQAYMEPILFHEVYPLYGAVDIRNSTVERNIALQNDLKTQLNLLIKLLSKLDIIHHLDLIDEMKFKANEFLDNITQNFSGDEEYGIDRFFQEEIISFLVHFQQTYPKSHDLISDYYLSSNPKGIGFANRNALENSLQTINTAISNLLDQMNAELQNAYPFFFEKFRSDGVEYDIYIGQSITPNKEFHPMYLKNLRLWQITSMAIIAKLSHSLMAQLPKPLQTTQLIFIHTNPIDISFRYDERHFDVEGAYNIRYEIVKKRIDKVHLKNSSERLTQPDKIAFVYFQPKDIEDYLSYINYLQKQDILNDDLEFLELEELQGVSGLKALRVGVNLHASGELLPKDINAFASAF
ncbi:MAG: GAF domain-containing protein [Arachidicoccus sp.]|nr:GAF domain-containing protein [Arachidicoccus sp.]